MFIFDVDTEHLFLFNHTGKSGLRLSHNDFGCRYGRPEASVIFIEGGSRSANPKDRIICFSNIQSDDCLIYLEKLLKSSIMSFSHFSSLCWRNWDRRPYDLYVASGNLDCYDLGPKSQWKRLQDLTLQEFASIN